MLSINQVYVLAFINGYLFLSFLHWLQLYCKDAHKFSIFQFNNKTICNLCASFLINIDSDMIESLLE